jgi:hypothetical protein
MKKMCGFFTDFRENPRLIKTFSLTNAMKIKTMIALDPADGMQPIHD